MNANTHSASSVGKARVATLLALAVVATTVACSTNSKPVASTSAPEVGTLRPAAMKTVVHAAEHPVLVPVAEKSAAKPSPTKYNVFRTRNYGVSFQYPWQYAYMSAKAVGNAGPELQPKSDGHDGQFTLVRVEVPRGFYADTDFESGYFMLSVNQDLKQEECESVLGKDAKKDTINGTEFRWLESNTGGKGHADKIRQYVAFSNDTCYEIELGVKTSNEGGLAREVDADQVMRRLDSILTTVSIQKSEDKPAEVKTSVVVPPAVPQN